MNLKTKIEQITLKTTDNIEIAANYLKNGFQEIVIIVAGWCMTKDSKTFLEITEAFSQKYDVLTIDCRGHGKSKGLFSFSAKEPLDISAAIEFVNTEHYQKKHLLGFSLGAASSLIYCSQNPEIEKLILVSPPTEFSKIENKMWKKEAWKETFKKFELGRFLSIRPCVVPLKKIKPIDVVHNIKTPTLFIAGSKDPTVLSWHTIKLYEKATCNKKLHIFENGIHAEDLFIYFQSEFMNSCFEWLKL